MADADDGIVSVGDFFTCRDYVPVAYEFGDATVTIECLQAAATDFDLTGQVVWLVSVLTSWYLAKHRDMLRDTTVVELGAGAGLPGMLATKFAKRVVLTDYEDEVLKLLERNLKHAGKDCETLLFNLSWGEAADHTRLAQLLTQKDHKSSDTPSSVSTNTNVCPIIIGADIVYWSASIEPLAETVAAMLEKPHGKFILGYYNRVDPNRKKLLDAMSSRGLQHRVIDPLGFLPSPPPAKLEEFLDSMTLYEFTWRDEM